MTIEEARNSAIILIRSGSHLVGLNIETSDEDELGILIEPISLAIGLNSNFEQFDADPASGDCTIYGLRKYLRLACKGNPTIIQLLFTPPSCILSINNSGRELIALRDKIISRRAGKAFLGYLTAQRQRMLGLRGNGGHGKMRTELTAAHGFDTKYAMHMLRLGMQGKELLETGSLEQPLPERQRSFLLSVRAGKVPIEDCIRFSEYLEADLENLLTTSPLRPNPDLKAVEGWMISTYRKAWA